MKTISQREFRSNSAAIMDAVVAGEIYRITRNGVEFAELRPLPCRHELTSDELVTLVRDLPRVDYQEMRREATEFLRR